MAQQVAVRTGRLKLDTRKYDDKKKPDSPSKGTVTPGNTQTTFREAVSQTGASI
jgi:hypothetical protein